jgi:hypothetical protein
MGSNMDRLKHFCVIPVTYSFTGPCGATEKSANVILTGISSIAKTAMSRVTFFKMLKVTSTSSDLCMV